MKSLKYILSVAAIVAGLGYSALITQYGDCSGLGNNFQKGRTKNSISTVIAGIVAQKMHKNSSIDLTVEKKMFPDSRITGYATKDTIDTYMDLTFSHVHFAAGNNNDKMKGTVDKSEWNWKVIQKNNNTYEIQRQILKWDGELDLRVYDGKIEGEYKRGGFAWNWDIKGTYDKKGNVAIEIDAPWTLDLELKGEIKKVE